MSQMPLLTRSECAPVLQSMMASGFDMLPSALQRAMDNLLGSPSMQQVTLSPDALRRAWMELFEYSPTMCGKAMLASGLSPSWEMLRPMPVEPSVLSSDLSTSDSTPPQDLSKPSSAYRLNAEKELRLEQAARISEAYYREKLAASRRSWLEANPETP
jgi:hypothetical protein